MAHFVSSATARISAMLLALCMAPSAWGDADAGFLSLFAKDGLWRNVQARCLAPGAPHHPDCAVVDRAKGLVLYKDAIGRSHFLVIPDHRVTGVEERGVWEDGGPNPWAFGWDARQFVGQARGRPLPDAILGLAINAKASRSQEQMHIHLDCISRDARDFVSGANARIGTTWTALRFMGKPVQAIFVPSPEASMSVNPFLLIKHRLGDAAPVVPDRGVFVTYVPDAAGTSGFVIVDQPVDREAGSNGHASDFLDRQCKLAPEDTPAARE
ncbi:CDP-diacylglycerol diphosphatase [Cupriavidus basilensis]|nr:CDP-diacylglycerol diphosphatase [Cupriavidus basilensis]